MRKEGAVVLWGRRCELNDMSWPLMVMSRCGAEGTRSGLVETSGMVVRSTQGFPFHESSSLRRSTSAIEWFCRRELRDTVELLGGISESVRLPLLTILP